MKSGLPGWALRAHVELQGFPDNRIYTFNVGLKPCFGNKRIEIYMSQSQEGSQDTNFVQNAHFFICHILQVVYFEIYPSFIFQIVIRSII